MKPVSVSSREYKLMLDHRLFTDRKAAAGRLWGEVSALAEQLDVRCRGEFGTAKNREIEFLDTADATISLNGFVFRKRTNSESGVAEYTLKCRSADRYVAAGANVHPANTSPPQVKLEEDIAAPFVVRFAHSGSTAGPTKRPQTLKQAAKLFPALGELLRDNEPCPVGLRLQPVNALSAYERVLKGPAFLFGNVEAEVAVILWSDGPIGRPLVAEFSFRYGSKVEQFSAKLARAAMQLFERLQRLDWFLPEGRTKTQYVYQAR